MAKRIDKVPKRFQKKVESQLRGLSKSLQDRRKIIGLTQEQLAERLEISLDTIKAIESGRRYPSLPMLAYVCSAMKIELVLKN